MKFVVLDINSDVLEISNQLCDFDTPKNTQVDDDLKDLLKLLQSDLKILNEILLRIDNIIKK